MLFAVSLNDGHIFDIIFSDEYIMDIVGALECEHFYFSFINYSCSLYFIYSNECKHIHVHRCEYLQVGTNESFFTTGCRG